MFVLSATNAHRLQQVIVSFNEMYRRCSPIARTTIFLPTSYLASNSSRIFASTAFSRSYTFCGETTLSGVSKTCPQFTPPILQTQIHVLALIRYRIVVE